MIRIARVSFGIGVVLVVTGLGVHVLTWGSPIADAITMWMFIAGCVIGAPGAMILDAWRAPGRGKGGTR